jgi:hypothetical protein
MPSTGPSKVPARLRLKQFRNGAQDASCDAFGSRDGLDATCVNGNPFVSACGRIGAVRNTKPCRRTRCANSRRVLLGSRARQPKNKTHAQQDYRLAVLSTSLGRMSQVTQLASPRRRSAAGPPDAARRLLRQQPRFASLLRPRIHLDQLRWDTRAPLKSGPARNNNPRAGGSVCPAQPKGGRRRGGEGGGTELMYRRRQSWRAVGKEH